MPRSYLLAKIARHLLNGYCFHLNLPPVEDHPEGFITAGSGSLVDWRTIRSGDTICTDQDPFDLALTLTYFVPFEYLEKALEALEPS